MLDLIDRQAAIEALGKRPGLAGECEWEIAARAQYDADRAAIESVPSAQPERKAGRWIPVTERLPEVDENVLVSYHFDADTEFPPFDGVTISYWTGVKNHNIPHFADIGDACTILAWMPLPEPYKEEDDARSD